MTPSPGKFCLLILAIYCVIHRGRIFEVFLDKGKLKQVKALHIH